MRVIGICTTNIAASPQRERITLFQEFSKEKNWKLLIFNAFIGDFQVYQPNKTDGCIFSLINPNIISAMIITQEVFKFPEITNIILEICKKSNIPIISLGYPSDQCYNVLFDDSECFEKLVDHLIERHNCKVLNIVAGIKNNAFSDSRITAFKRSLANHNIEFDPKRLIYGEFWKNPTLHGLKEFFASGLSLPDAFVCCNDTMAIVVCDFLQQHNIKVPKDVIVTGYDGIEEEKYAVPRLTTIKCDYPFAVRTIINLIEKLLSGQECPSTTNIPSTLIFSQSCGCIPTDISKSNSYSFAFIDIVAKYRFLNHTRQEMIIHGTRADHLSTIQDILKPYLPETCWFLVNKSFFDINNMSASSLNIPFNDTLDVFLCTENSLFCKKQSINKSELIPNLTEILTNEEDCLVFTAIFFRNDVIGYYVQPYSTDDFTLLQMEYFTETAGLLFSEVKSREKLEYLLTRDVMTGIYNRRGFYTLCNEQLTLLKGFEYYFILYSIDMDELKSINDTYGHKEGDHAIKVLANAIKLSIDSKGIPSRFGGDEFVIASFQKSYPENSVTTFKKTFFSHLDDFNTNSGKPYTISASCGSVITKIPPDMQIDQIISQADKIMYNEKKIHHRASSRN